MLVRRATIEDLKPLAYVFDEYRQSYAMPSDINQSLAFLQHLFLQQRSVIFIHCKNEQITGFVMLHSMYALQSCSAYYVLDDVYVSPSYRSHGSAKQLIDTAIQFARQDNAMRISVETTQNNPHAQQLYSKMGFLKDEPFQKQHCFLR